MVKFDVRFKQTDHRFNVSVDPADRSFTADFGHIQTVTKIDGDIELYDGAYEVTPDAHNPVVLNTKDKMMADDVTVNKVPYFQTSNATGDTVYIASEVV